MPAVAFRAQWLGPIAAFWTAYVITRPLGASFADWMGVSTARGGLGLGTGRVTAAWTAVIVALVGCLAYPLSAPLRRATIRVSCLTNSGEARDRSQTRGLESARNDNGELPCGTVG